jgi:hypothetical protein
MRQLNTNAKARITVPVLLAAGLLAGSLAGCGVSSDILSMLPLARITAVQLFDQPNYTTAFSIEAAISNPSLVSKINWVFGDGSGFVEGPAGRSTITHRYTATGVYQVTAYVFQGANLVGQIDGSVTIMPNGGGTPGTGTTPGTLPGQIRGPNPRDKATDVNVTAKLTWTAGDNATSHDVYLGTVKADVENAGPTDASYQGTLTTSQFDPGGLTPDTEYFWRIDERNDAGVTKGTVLSFKTAKAPTKAKDFVPVDGAGAVPVDRVLRWTAGANTTSHDVYFGKDLAAVTGATKDTPDLFKGNQSAASFDPQDDTAEITGQLLAATTYYWRIDETGLGGTTKGDVLHFHTADPPPPVTNPDPPDNDPPPGPLLPVDVNATLSWSAPASVSSFDVYLGTDTVAVNGATHGSPEFKGNQTAKAFDPGELWGATTYYWRIDTLGPGGTSHGNIFSFLTAEPPAEVVYTSPLDGASGVATDTILDWEPPARSGPTDGYNVYLSTDQNAVLTGATSAFKGNQPVLVTQYDPQTLSANTKYFWRIDAAGPGGTTMGAVWQFRTGPGAASGPTPADLASGVETEANVGWTAGAGATSHNVYFGTNAGDVGSDTPPPGVSKGNQTSTTFDPGTLAAGTLYFWRIDEVGPGGTTKGEVWEFTTKIGQASGPTPGNGATNVGLGPTLNWGGAPGAMSHDIYFGTSTSAVLNATTASAEYKGNVSGTSAPSPISPLTENTLYYWRIDEVDVHNNVTKGLVWSFRTRVGRASNPGPSNGDTTAALNVVLSWTAGTGATQHRVYFGFTYVAVDSAIIGSAEDKGVQTGTTWPPDIALVNSTSYFWRIDEISADGTSVTKGDVWTFTTVP